MSCRQIYQQTILKNRHCSIPEDKITSVYFALTPLSQIPLLCGCPDVGDDQLPASTSRSSISSIRGWFAPGRDKHVCAIAFCSGLQNIRGGFPRRLRVHTLEHGTAVYHIRRH
ncbi:hypothetical protein J6590_069061 [Homalodisca vitripennis]|nr:hypothetical protein J6590_069061 [Homalodisca vitripennis]